MSQKLPPQVVRTTHHFTVLLSATRRGARLARLLTERQLEEWGTHRDGAAHVVAELAANAVTHGHVRGRDFRLALRLHPDGTLRIEVTDARGDRIPRVLNPGAECAESGRGLLIVAAYSERWGVDEAPAHGKTVWAELGPDRRIR